jgi:hypothetical protein
MVGLEVMELLEMQPQVAAVVRGVQVLLEQHLRAIPLKVVVPVVLVDHQASQEQPLFMQAAAAVELMEQPNPLTVPWRHLLEIPELAEAVLVVQVALKQPPLTRVISEIEATALGEL